MAQNRPRSLGSLPVSTVLVLSLAHALTATAAGQDAPASGDKASPVVAAQQTFDAQVRPLLKRYCLRCHNADEMKSGIRLDPLNGKLPDKHLFLWKDVLKQVAGSAMPPEDEPQPTAEQRRFLATWIRTAMAAATARDAQNNGSVRRLTVAQYRNTLRDLLGLEENLTHVLPPDSVSKEGFDNNSRSMLLSPLLIESYFDIAQRALDLCLVDESRKPVIQNFRVDLGDGINPDPCPDKLILGALSRLLANDDFRVTELAPSRPFAYEPFAMRTAYRFIEGYQGNATVRGWREYDSIYHAVFACVRGTDGYPKGHAYQTVSEGLLLRPAIPSAELFQVESTYGPKANFKISLRELPDHGRFRVTVRAARYDDGLLLDRGAVALDESGNDSVTVSSLTEPQTVNLDQAGVYQVDVHTRPFSKESVRPDASKLEDQLVGAWLLNGNTHSSPERKELTGRLQGDAKFVDSPFGQAVTLDGNGDSIVVDRDDSMNVGTGEFTVAAWIHPRELRQSGIVCLGKYSWTHGWYLDMPNNQGVLRIETASPRNRSNGTVASQPGIIRVNQWQHVAAVVRRAVNETRLYVNGYQVAAGTIAPTSLDNPAVKLHIGRIQDAQQFKGEIDEVRFYRRALEVAEIQALLESGRRFVQPPPPGKPQNLALTLGSQQFSGMLQQPAFLVVRLPAGPLTVAARYGNQAPLNRVVLSPLQVTGDVAQRFLKFEQRSPRLGVYVGLRRDCGSTLTQVGKSQTISESALQKYVFEGAISNYPSPDVEKDNVNYLAGVREIGVRSEYTDGRDRPRMLIASVEFEGPLYETWPPRTHRNIFIDSDHKHDPAVYAAEVIRSFATRAFRRPVTPDELASLLAVWKNAFDGDADFPQAIQDALLVVLTSPQFLFLIENSASPQAEPLDSYELASKLSYFLWNTAPDNKLLNRAADRSLYGALDSEINRMIQDRRFDQFAHEFTSQWLTLDKLDVLEVDRKRYPKLTRDTKAQLRREPVQFLKYLIQHNLPLRNLIQSDFVVANEVVASYYGLADRTESGFAFRAIRHDRGDLGGLLSQAGILAGLSDGRESNPVKRGAWLARKIIAEPPDDPPPNVPALDGIDLNLPLRARLAQHRNQKGCAACHAGIDPWGIPLEQFDAGGLFKHGQTVDARSTLPDETRIADFAALRNYLVRDRIDRVAFSFLKHLASYARGRNLGYTEIEMLQEKAIELKSDGYRMRDLLRFVIQSDLFLKK